MEGPLFKGNEEDSSVLLKLKNQEYTVEIREKKKRETLNLKRIKVIDSKTQPASPGTLLKSSLESIENICQGLNEGIRLSDMAKIVSEIRNLRNILTTSLPDAQDQEEFANLCEKVGIVAKLLELWKSRCNLNNELCVESSWCLCNLTAMSSGVIDACVKFRLVEMILSIITDTANEIRDNCLWILANFCGESLEIRDLLLKQGFLKFLKKVMKENEGDNCTMKVSAWLLSNFARGKPYPEIAHFKIFFEILGNNINSKDEKLVLYTLMTLTYFTEYNQDINIPAVFSIGVTDKICQMISNSKNDELKALAFRYCGNMTLGDQKVTECLLNNGILRALYNKLEDKDSATRSEALWVLSNLCVVDNQCVLQRIVETGVLAKGIKLIKTGTYQNRIDATYCLQVLLEKGSFEQIRLFSEVICIEDLIDNLSKVWSADLIKITLVCICKTIHRAQMFAYQHNLKCSTNGVNPCVKKLITAHNYHYIEDLLDYPNEEIQEHIRLLVDEIISPALVKLDSCTKMSE